MSREHTDSDRQSAATSQSLRELVDEWRYDFAQRAGSGGYYKAAAAYEQCAEELEEALEDAE